MKTPSNKKSLIWLLVLNGKKEASNEQLEASLNGFSNLLLNYSEFHYVFSIIHNKDTTKAIHSHTFIELYEAKTLKQMLDLLQELLHIDRQQISLEPSNSDILGIQYLTHKNQPEKEQYSYDEIKANNAEMLALRYGESYKSEDDLRKEKLLGSHTMQALIEAIGLDYANKYRAVWKEIQDERGYSKDKLITFYNRAVNDILAISENFKKLIDTLGTSLTQRELRLIDYEKWLNYIQDIYLYINKTY